MPDTPRQRVLFEDLVRKPVRVELTAPDSSSDSGVLLLKAVDRKMGLTERLAAALRDPRQPAKVCHGMREILQERIFGIAFGYPDANDAARLAHDRAVRLACERRAGPLASQPTLSRFENSPTSTDLLRMALALTDAVLDRERAKRRGKRVRRITIDMDPTEDHTYGQQHLALFNALYDSWCYLPMVTTVQFNEESEHYAIAPMLRPGNAARSERALPILKRLVPRLRERFPEAVIRVRMDGAFATPPVFDCLEANRLGYAVSMARNSVLEGCAAPWLERMRRRVEATGLTQKTYAEAAYQAGKWRAPRRVVIKAEVVALDGREPRDNPRFVVTNLQGSPRSVYRFYGLRGDLENRIKELKDGLRFDLTSCTRFAANQFRTVLASAAYALNQQLRWEARGTECAHAQVQTLRERLVKLAATVRETARRILLEAPRAYVWLAAWRLVALRLGASP